MDARTFFGLSRTGERRWSFDVVPGISTGGGFLFGGCALGAAIDAMEAETDRPVRWATAQYLDYARPGQTVDVDVVIAADGRHTSQARALCTVKGREIIAVNAAFGARELPETRGQWVTMPSVPPPQECGLRTLRMDQVDSITSRLETRMADARSWTELDGTPGSGRSALWARVPEVLDLSAAALAILADFVPFGIGQSLGLPAGGTSLDNTIRMVRLVPTEWVLIDIEMHGIAGGFGHGLVHLWSSDGTLLATGSQTAIVRHWNR